MILKFLVGSKGLGCGPLARIHANDPQRIQRALEVFELTGQPISDFHDSGRRSGFPYAAIKMVLAPADRERMHSRIEARFRQMLEAGFIDEVRALCQRGDLDAGLPAMRAVGYRQGRWFAGRLSRHASMQSDS